MNAALAADLSVTDPTVRAMLKYCDACGAQGKIRVEMKNGSDLVFCAHHARVYDAKLQEVAFTFDLV